MPGHRALSDAIYALFAKMGRLPKLLTADTSGRQQPEAVHQEEETRQAGNFEAMECALPSLSYRLPRWPAVDALTSYLGTRNPFGRAYDPLRDELWMFDNTAYRSSNGGGGGNRKYHNNDDSGQWTAEFVGAFFRKDSGKDLGKVVADVAEKLGYAKGAAEEATIASRLEAFVNSVAPARTVQVLVGGGSNNCLKLGPGGRSGIVSEERALPAGQQRQQHHDGDKVVSYAAKNSKINMVTNFATPEGWLVVSDVDDTIKVTMTASPLGILRTTFVDTPEPVAGMPELYRHIDGALVAPAWFYLSASPYNLYTFLRDFRAAHYPHGTIILRDASWMTLGGFLSSLTVGTQAYKVSRLEKIRRWLPRRRVVCIGDSTQTDPETYGEMYRNSVGRGDGASWIKAIYIRKVFNVAEMARSDKNSDERFERAFRGVPRSVWRTFVDPQELYQAVDELKRSSA